MSPYVHHKPSIGFLSSFYHAIEYDDNDDNEDDDDDDDDDDDFDHDEFRFNDASIHEGHFPQNGLLTLFGIETTKR